MAQDRSFIVGAHFDARKSGSDASASEQEPKIKDLRHALIEGEGSGVAGPLNIEKIKQRGRREAGPAPR